MRRRPPPLYAADSGRGARPPPLHAADTVPTETVADFLISPATEDAVVTFGNVQANPLAREATQDWATPPPTSPPWVNYEVTVVKTSPLPSQTLVDHHVLSSTDITYTFALGARAMNTPKIFEDETSSLAHSHVAHATPVTALQTVAPRRR